MPDINLYLPFSLDDAPVCVPDADGHCSVCADEGLPGRVLELRADNMALADMPGGPQEVALDLIDDAQVGDWLLVHLGFAIARLNIARLKMARLDTEP